MYQKIRVGAVSYLNAKPLTYGFLAGKMKEEVELVFAPPARLAAQMLGKELDIALLPVAVMPELPEAHIISDFCIGANDDVASVAVFSEVPLQEVKKILLDTESRTSVELLRILLHDHWKISPELVPAYEGYEKDLKGDTAGLVIGNRALMQRSVSSYCYDLAGAWKEMTGLPFVFAAWVSNRPLPEDFKNGFNKAVEAGLGAKAEIAAAHPFPYYDLERYFNQDISYNLDASKLKAMELFLSKIGNSIRIS